MKSPAREASRYQTLLSPMLVGAYTLRNRVIMGSMHTCLEHATNWDGARNHMGVDVGGDRLF